MGRDVKPPASRPRSAGWLRTLHQWHWISSALSLAGLLLFAVTGFTLNHGEVIEAQPRVVRRALQLPAPLHNSLAPQAEEAEHSAPLPPALLDWLSQQLDRPIDASAADWTRGSIELTLPRPGGEAWLRIDRGDGRIEFEDTDRGLIAQLNDLHKGRNTGPAWRLFIDVFAASCLLFAITGLLILKHHAAQRAMTWPLAGFGLLLPLLIVLLLIH